MPVFVCDRFHERVPTGNQYSQRGVVRPARRMNSTRHPSHIGTAAWGRSGEGRYLFAIDSMGACPRATNTASEGSIVNRNKTILAASVGAVLMLGAGHASAAEA